MLAKTYRLLHFAKFNSKKLRKMIEIVLKVVNLPQIFFFL
nr:MAG TPA: hypothetical protein [Caudoviricetes sp.]